MDHQPPAEDSSAQGVFARGWNVRAHGRTPTLSKYTDLDALFTLVAGGDVQLIKASHFLTLAAQEGGRFLRRQDLPQEAYATRADLERWIAECKATAALRNKWAGVDNAESELLQGARFPPFVIVSYAWYAASPSKRVFSSRNAVVRPRHRLSPEHPDPDGRQLREVLAPAIEWYMSERANYIDGGVVAVHFTDAEEEAKLAAPFTAEGIDFGMFIDFSSLW